MKSQKQIIKPSQINSSLYMQQISSCSSSYDDDTNKSSNIIPITTMTTNNVTTINITSSSSTTGINEFPNLLKRNSSSRISDTTVGSATTTPTSNVYSCSGI